MSSTCFAINSAHVTGSSLALDAESLPHFLQQPAFNFVQYDPWYAYAMSSLSPELQSLELYYQQSVAPGILASTVSHFGIRSSEYLLPIFANNWNAKKETYLKVGLFEGSAAQFTHFTFDSDAFSYSDPNQALERSFLVPGYIFKLNADNSWAVSAIIAKQRLNESRVGGDSNYSLTQSQDYVDGTGVRVGFNSRVSNFLSLDASYQSKINMDTIQSFNGAFSEPGDFDIPASANLGFALKAGESSTLKLGVRYILYSGINAISSQSLPRRFLSLLGDGSSPDFSWQDRTVYSLGFQWEATDTSSWNVNYSTSTQPLPTSSALLSALAPDFADRQVSIAYKMLMSGARRFDFSARYAPASYLLGLPTYQSYLNRSEELGVEAVWSWGF